MSQKFVSQYVCVPAGGAGDTLAGGAAGGGLTEAGDMRVAALHTTRGPHRRPAPHQVHQTPSSSLVFY